jgi:ABC-2 type transport system ATP-binding protein
VGFAEIPDRMVLDAMTDARVIVSQDGLKWSIQTDDPEGMKRRLLELSLSHKLNIVSLHTETGSLEEVFRRLTASN